VLITEARTNSLRGRVAAAATTARDR